MKMILLFIASLCYANDDLELIHVLEDGTEISGTYMNGGERVEIGPEVNIVAIDDLFSYAIRGSQVFVDAELIYTNNLLYVVSPVEHVGGLYALQVDDFTDLVFNGFAVAESPFSHSVYIGLDTAFLDREQVVSRTIDPFHCDNTHDASTNKPHQVDPSDKSKGCHGATGQNGHCTSQNTEFNSYVFCSSSVSPISQTIRETCFADIQCQDGGLGSVTTGTTTFDAPRVRCTTRNGQVAVTHEGGRGTIRCGNQTYEMDCN